MVENSLPGKSGLVWLWLTVFVIALDQATKAIVLHTLTPYVPHPVIPGFFDWTLAFNTGAAFSFLAEHPQWSRWLFSVIAIVVSACSCAGSRRRRAATGARPCRWRW